MMAYLPLMFLLVFLAISTRDDFALTLLYLFLGSFAAGTWWSRRSFKQVTPIRKVDERAFLGQTIQINLKIHNQGWMPILWLRTQEALPVALSPRPNLEQVASLAPYSELDISYTLEAHKRGYYQLGPLFLSSGDILGLLPDIRSEGQSQFITVFPKIISLANIRIPSSSPQGTLRHHQPIFEDPTRIMGKRDYVAGDSMRRVDWKSSATTGRLQVKLFEPSIALDTMIFLDLGHDGYHYRHRIDAAELAIVIAASMASWIISKGQSAGLKVNGKDPLAADGLPRYSPSRKGQAHLVQMLETLARVELQECPPIVEMIQRQRYLLPWGMTLIVITGTADDLLLGELYQARRSGLNALLVLAGPVAHSQEITFRAAHFGVPTVNIANEQGLDIWRR